MHTTQRGPQTNQGSTTQASTKQQRSTIPVGVFSGSAVIAAAFWVPASIAAGEPHAGTWFLVVLLQLATTAEQIGWQLLGLAAGLLAAVVALVAFVGSRSATAIALPKREATQNVASWLLTLATGLATLATSALLLAIVFTPLFGSNLDVLSASSAESKQIQEALTVQINSIVIGFTGLGLLTAAWFLDQAVQAWDASDQEELAREITLVEMRLAQRRSAVTAARKAHSAGSTSIAMTAAVTLLAIGGVSVLLTIALVFWRLVRAEPLDLTIASFAIACFTIAMVQSTIVSAAFWEWRTIHWSGPAVAEVNGRPTVQKPRWRRRRTGKVVILVATSLVIPVLAAGSFLISGSANSLGEIVVGIFLTVLVLGLPVLVVVVPRGPRSWDAAARESAVRRLHALILADEERRDELAPAQPRGVLRRLWSRLARS